MLFELTADELTRRLDKNVRDTVAKLKVLGDPVLKETRTFGVMGYPHYFSCISSHYPGLPHFIHEKVRSHNEEVSAPWPSLNVPSVMMYPDYPHRSNVLVQPIMESLLFRDRKKLFTIVRTSNKTILRGKPMSEHISNAIRTVRGGSVIVPTLQVLTSHISPLLSHIFEPGAHDVLHPRLLQYMEALLDSRSKEDVILRLRNVPPADWDVATSLKMRVKLYIGRADRRAYYVDTDLLRHLCGSILQTLLLCPTRHLRSRLGVSEWYPVYEKNTLDLHFVLDINYSAVAILGDLSSFTNNDVNSWLGCIALYSEVRSFEEATVPRSYCIRGEIVRAKLIDVLLMYLLTWVGSTSTLPDHSTYRSIGGYLGIKANILLTIYSFVVRLLDIQRSIHEQFPTIKMTGQVGGDDFILILMGPDLDELLDISEGVLSSLRTYVGELKDPYVIPIPFGTYELDAEFCKKSVVTTVDIRIDSNHREYKYLSVQSMEKLPLMSELIERDDVKGSKSRRNAFRLFRLQIEHYLKTYSCRHVIANAYLHAYVRIYDMPGYMQRVHWTTKSTSSFLLVLWNDKYFTQAGMRKLLMMDNLSDEEGNQLTEGVESRLAILLSSQQLTVSMAEIDGERQNVYHKAKGDDRWIVRATHSETITIEPEGLAVQVANIFRYARWELAPFLDSTIGQEWSDLSSVESSN